MLYLKCEVRVLCCLVPYSDAMRVLFKLDVLAICTGRANTLDTIRQTHKMTVRQNRMHRSDSCGVHLLFFVYENAEKEAKCSQVSCRTGLGTRDN